MLDTLFALLTLIFLEAILGIDNLVFISIVSSRLPEPLQKKARRIGLMLAWITRLISLGLIFWMIHLTKPILQIHNFALSWRDIFLIGGGVFLLAKATYEIHHEMDSEPHTQRVYKGAKFLMVITQIAMLDIVFSLDSIFTAVGLTHQYWIMATSITIAIILMILASEPLTGFVNKHPTVKMLALSFLLLIGTILIADGLHFHVPRGYIYFSVCFSLLVEFLNLRSKSKKTKVK